MSLENGSGTIQSMENVGTQVAGERATRDSFEDNICSEEKVFRGFQKRPIVLLERCNVLPLLNNNRVTYNQKSNTDAGTNGFEQINLHLQKLALQCSVVLIREDLEKLKRDICKKYSGDTTNISKVVSNAIKTAFNTAKKQDNQTDIGSKVDKDNTRPQKRVSFSEHIIVHVVADYHRCRKCTKIFKDYKCLKLHIRRRHRKRKRYICNYCSKIFLDRILFKNHIKLHCDICGVLTQNKVQYLDHKHNVCRSKKKYTCKTCNKNYFKFMDLKEHSYEHIGSFFICDICKDQFERKCALVHHISFLHSEKPPKELYTFSNSGSDRHYRCNFCNQRSVEKEMIESHASILPDLKNQSMTTYKDYSFCDQCLRRFDTENNMLQHKSHNLKTSDNSQLREDGLMSNECDKQNGSNVNDNTKDTEEEPSVNKNGDEVDIIEDNLSITTPKKPAMKSMLYNILNPSNTNENGTRVSSDVTHQIVDRIDYTNPPKKAIVDPKSKKTIISRFNCELCGKYYSSNYTLSRHKATQHGVNKGLQCHVCEETFVWPSLLESHKCIRTNIPEMPFDDARPEILFENMAGPNNSDPLYGEDDGMMGMDFDMPAPIVELTEYDQFIVTEPTNQQINNLNNLMCVMPLPDANYKLVVQEVPIEF